MKSFILEVVVEFNCVTLQSGSIGLRLAQKLHGFGE